MSNRIPAFRSKSSKRNMGRVAASLSVLCAALAMSAATASASQRYGPLSGRIGEAGAGGSGNGEFSDPDGVAVDQVTGHVYVVDSGNSRVEEFDAAGAYLAQFSGASTPAGGFSGPTAVAVDQTTGDVYVVDTGNNVVDEFTPSGVYICELSGWERGCQATPVEPPSFSTPIGVAVDPTTGGAASGDVYVSDKENRVVDVFTAGGSDVAQFSPGYRPWSLAVDSNSDVYVAGAGAEQINEYTSAGAEPIRVYKESELDSRIRTVGVDTTTNDVFILGAEPEAGGAQIFELDPAGQPVPAPEQNIFGGGLVSAPPEAEFSPGISVNSASGAVYVADPANNVVDIFVLVTVPDATTGGVANITLTGATVEGLVNAHGASGTEYFFQYGKNATYESETEHIAIGEGEGEKAIAELAGLEPGTTYHYRLVARNSSGIPSDGEDRAFTTAPLPPEAVREETSNVTSISVLFRGEVVPGNDAAIYHFEYGPTASYGQVLPDIGIGVGTTPIVVEQASLANLVAGRIYHYRVVVISGAGEAAGPDQTFETPSTSATPTALPTIDLNSTSAVSQTGATISATIDPGGHSTTYVFELGYAAGNYESRVFGNLAGEPGSSTASATFTNLQAGVVYHYRVVATNAAGTTATADQTFATAQFPQSITIPPTPLLVPTPVFPPVHYGTTCKKGYVKHGSKCVRKKSPKHKRPKKLKKRRG